ncbi:MAG: vWA domain-containing protein [Akkermansiaceae bacterium]
MPRIRQLKPSPWKTHLAFVLDSSKIRGNYFVLFLQMSNLGQTGPAAARSALRRQQRTATLVSLITALLLMLLIGLILAIILFKVGPDEKATMISYSSQAEPEQKITKPKIKTEVKRKPAAPSMAMSRVVVANSQSPTPIPIPKIEVEDISMDIGVGEDFGGGWGDGNGFGGGGGATFFGQTVRAERIAYVIDFSSSMKGQNRHQLMRDELSQSLGLMNPGLQIGIIFFSGPAWVAGDAVKGTTVTTPKGKTFKWKRGKGHSHWEHDGKKQEVPWWTITEKEIKRLTKIVKTAPLSGGTVWDNPLNMALDMDPPPQMIYFMTDGAASGSDKWAKEIGDRAKDMGVVINCVALMQPKAEKDLKTMAEATGGQLTMVDGKGKRKQIK